jgi:HPt (histidine-containing phosphotransfer) domain-containing protein
VTGGAWFDEAAIPRLQRMIGADVVVEILDLFFETTPQRVAEVRSGDAWRAAQALHALKSSAAMVGGMELQGLAQDMERLAREGDAEAVGLRLADLQAAVARLNARLEAERARVGG